MPVFYWPRFVGDADDLEPPLRQFVFRTNNYFGQQVLTDWNGFQVFGLRRPDWIDIWNIDVDYLSARTKDFPALGSEIGWFGRDLIRDLTDPYHKIRDAGRAHHPRLLRLLRHLGPARTAGNDVLGPGPAIVTNGPPGAGKRGFQRSDVPAVPGDPRAGSTSATCSRSSPDDDEHRFEDFRLQLEVAYVSDRYFLEEYYKRLFETGLDQETLGYLQSPEGEQGRGPLGRGQPPELATPRPSGCPGSTTTGWATRCWATGSPTTSTRGSTTPTRTPPSRSTTRTSSRSCRTTRSRTRAASFSGGPGLHEPRARHAAEHLDVVRVVPYVQGQVVGWTNQIGGGPFGQQTPGRWAGPGARRACAPR